MADHLADDVLDEAGVAVRLLDDGPLVGALHELVDLGAHGGGDDVKEVACVDVDVDAFGGAEVELADAALVVGCDGDGVEDALDLIGCESVRFEPLARRVGEEALGAGAGGHAMRLDAGEGAGAA